MRRYIPLLLVLLWLFVYKPNQLKAPEFSFFVAGHTYGSPGVNVVGLYPPFKKQFPWLQSEGFDFGVLTGDIVIKSTGQEWDEVDGDIEELGVKVYFAPGNHDLQDRQLYRERYGETFYTFQHEGELFVVLDPTAEEWNISEEQLRLLHESLKNWKKPRIFIFCHQMIWWRAKESWLKYRPNSAEGRARKINFWSEIDPIFQDFPGQVYLFCGDVGARSNGHEYSYLKHRNLHLFCSGMGGGERDNFLGVRVLPTKVEVKLVALNGENRDALGPLKPEPLPLEE